MGSRYFFWLPFIFVAVLASCHKKDKNGKQLDTATTGEIGIAVDESFATLIAAEINTFQGLYRYAKINAHYLPENNAIEQLVTDSVQLAIVSRKLTPKETEYIEEQKLKIATVKVAVDAIALIVNKQNVDTLLSYEQVLDIMKGKIQNWKQVNAQSALSDIKIVFDSNNSSTVRYVKDSLVQNAQLPSNCFAVNSNPKVIDYVSDNVNAFGLIGVGWISDQDDSVSRGFLDKIKVVYVSAPHQAKSETEFYQPYQAYISQQLYPFCRDILVVSRETRVGLGSGFIAFLASDTGQRIVLKSGLLPATMPLRIIKLSSSNPLPTED